MPDIKIGGHKFHLYEIYNTKPIALYRARELRHLWGTGFRVKRYGKKWAIWARTQENYHMFTVHKG